MPNIFRNTPIFYFQIPSHLFDAGIWAELKPASQSLYVFLAYRAQKGRNVILAASEIAAETGLSQRSVGPARTQLVKKGLVEAVSDGQRGYHYSLLDPFTKQPPTTVEDFDALTDAQLDIYFRHHIPTARRTTDGGLMFSCPFHTSTSAREKINDKVTVNYVTHGTWGCAGGRQSRTADGSHKVQCEAKGHLVGFEMAIAKKEGKIIKPSEASSRIRGILFKAERDARKSELLRVIEARAEAGIKEDVSSWEAGGVAEFAD